MKILSTASKLILKLLGWKLKNIDLQINKAVLVCAPHTSYWDGFYAILCFFVIKKQIKFAIKKEALFFPFSYIYPLIGAVSIDRKVNKDHTQSIVKQIVDCFNNTDELFFAIAPEGTRKYVEKWKTGFYYIAKGAKVPIILAYIDYKSKTMGFGPTLIPSESSEEDIDKIKAFYKSITPKNQVISS